LHLQPRGILIILSTLGPFVCVAGFKMNTHLILHHYNATQQLLLVWAYLWIVTQCWWWRVWWQCQ